MVGVTGVVLMGIGLCFVFYLVHMRIWAVTVHDRKGQLTLWIGGAANRNKDAFEERFRRLVEAIEKEIKNAPQTNAVVQDKSYAGR